MVFLCLQMVARRERRPVPAGQMAQAGRGRGGRGRSEELKSTARVFSKWYLGRGKHHALQRAGFCERDGEEVVLLPAPLLTLVVTR